MNGSIVEQPSAGKHLHDMWTSVAGSWGEHAAFVDARAERLTDEMLERSAPQPGDRVLELACGPGGLGLAAARVVGPGGHVVFSDVAPEMTSIAAARAEALGLDNVSTCVLDLDRIDQPDASYDVALCREGLMFALDPAGAVREVGRVLRPGGRFAIAVWGPRERNPWLGIVLDAVSGQLGMPVPPPGIPGPFSLDDEDALAALFDGDRFEGVVVDEVSTPMHADSFEEWWSRTQSLAGPLATMLAALPDDAKQAIRARAEAAVGAYATPSGLEFPGVSLVATGRRAA
jgi:ubiquinone/menaquinone biosynthesis C-methylase UbiE